MASTIWAAGALPIFKDDSNLSEGFEPRGYSFQLAFDKIDPKREYVLTAQVDRSNSRLFDQLIVEPSAKEGAQGDRRTKHAASNAPGHSY